MDNPVGAVLSTVENAAAAGDAAQQFAQMIDQAALSLGMQIFNQQQEALGEFQQEF